MKQTAVEWLVENLHLHNDVYFVTKDKRKIIEQAKEMEKEQIIEAWMATDNPLQRMSAEQYYNETYNTETK
jgi:hypothetical protein